MQKVISGETLVYSSKNNLEKDFEFILPEYLPGISRIVKTTVGIEKCTFSSSLSSAECDVALKICIIYVSEIGGKIKTASFHESVSFPMRDPFTFEGEFTAIPSCRCTSFSSLPLSTRKVSVKCNLHGAVSVYSPSKDTFFDKDGNEGLCLLKEKQTICTKSILPEEFFEQEAEIIIDEGKPSAGDIVYTNACFTDIKTKVSDGMLEFDAAALIHVLYEVSGDEAEDDDSTTYAICDTSVRVSSALSSDKIREGCLPFIYMDVCSLEPSVSFDPYGSNKNITLNLKYSVSGFVYETHERELVTDGFSENYTCVPEISKYTVDCIKSEIHMKDNFTVPVRADIRDLSEISRAGTCVHSVSIEHSEGKFFANAKALTEIIGANAQGEMISLDIPVMLRIPFEAAAPSENCVPDIILNICKCSAAVKEGQLTLSFEASIDGVMTEHTQRNLLCSLLEDTENPIVRNKGEIIICYPEKDDTLWNIAKKYHVYPEKIREINNLDSDSFSSRKAILIP